MSLTPKSVLASFLLKNQKSQAHLLQSKKSIKRNYKQNTSTIISLCAIMFLACFSSCMPIAKLIYGVKKPKPKTDKQVVEYAKNLFERDYPIYRPADSTAFNKLLKLNVNNVPDIIFFDSQGVEKSMHADTLETCTANAVDFIRQLSLLEDAPAKDLKKFDLMQHLVKINFQEIPEENKAYNNSIVIVWADWIGPKLNREGTSDWLRVYNELDSKSKDGLDLKIINLDLLEGMN